MTTESFNPDGTMINDLAELDLTSEMHELEQKKPWPSGHTARTLFKKADFRLVLIVMQKGAVIHEHHADGTIAVHVLKGKIRFTVQAQAYEVAANHVLTLGASIKHGVEALEDSAFLLTIAWTSADHPIAPK
jgi:quercetin dioxygenase-like cupin family protein